MMDDLVDLGTYDILQYDLYECESKNVDALPTLDKEAEVTLEWKGAIFKCRGIVPKRGQHDQRPSDVLET